MANLAERYYDAKKKILDAEFSRMNPQQREAVFTVDGPLLILAGAGSGKTTVLINRAANLLKYGGAYFSDRLPFGLSESDVDFLESYAAGAEKGAAAEQRAVELIKDSPVQPWQLMAITFTNKAAGELKQRLCDMLGEDQGNDIWAMTFHASCARMLRRNADRLGYDPRFTIYDTDDQKRVIKSVMNEVGIDDKRLSHKAVISEISRAKDSMISPEDFEQNAGEDYRLKRIARVYSMYQKRLKDSNAMDFDDLLYNTVRLLETDSEVLEYYQRRFRYIMVDEYQDTNHAQYRMIKLLAGGHLNLCVVGDDDQSIYKFRGATIENILNFEKHYPDARIIRLEQNYRSTQTILDAANSVISHNEERHAKRLWTANGRGDAVVVYSAENERAEADFIARTVTDHAANGGKYSDCAVLYRMSAISGSIENHLMRAGIPYRVVAGHKFYDRKEIRDAIAYLSVINNPSDEVRLMRIINEPKRGIGDRSIELAQEIAGGLGISLFEVLGTADQFANLARSASKMKAFYDMICGFAETANDPELDLSELLDTVMHQSGYIENLLLTDERAQDRIENINELGSSLLRYAEDAGDEASLGGFLEDVALITDIDSYDTSADCVSLMTLHAAKGLEFPVVFIPGAEEGIFPGMLTMLDPTELEEDRRLAYVGITRAKQQLYISHAENRTLYGQTVRNKLSRYIGEIDGALIEEREDPRRAPVQSSDFRRKREPASSPVDNALSGGISIGQHSGAKMFRKGDRVKHRVFGEGEVLSASSMGGDILLEINFLKVGTKKLMANYAGLKKL